MDHRAPKAIRFGLTVSLILAAALGSGCDQSGPGTPGDLTTTNDTVNGVIRVTNSGTAPEWRLTPVVSIGPKTLLVGDGGPEEFAEVRSAALGPDNEVFIADGDNAEVRVFGLDGEHRHTFGRHGEGPGEFSDITSLAWVGDRLLTLDLIGGRIGEFSADGETLGQRQAPGRWGGGMALRFYPVGADEAYSVSHVADATGMTVVFVGQTSAGETGDTLPVREDPWEQGITCEYNEGWISFFEIIYSPKLVQHPGPGGVMYQARTDMYRIAVTRGADTLRIIERTLPAEGVHGRGVDIGHRRVQDLPRRDAGCGLRSPEARSASHEALHQRDFPRSRRPALGRSHPDGRKHVGGLRPRGATPRQAAAPRMEGALGTRVQPRSYDHHPVGQPRPGPCRCVADRSGRGLTLPGTLLERSGPQEPDDCVGGVAAVHDERVGPRQNDHGHVPDPGLVDAHDAVVGSAYHHGTDRGGWPCCRQ